MTSCMRNEASDFEEQILKESVVIPSSNPAIQVSYEMAAITTGWGEGVKKSLAQTFHGPTVKVTRQDLGTRLRF